MDRLRAERAEVRAGLKGRDIWLFSPFHYEARYNTLTYAIENETDSLIWTETISFYLLESEKNSVGLKDSILCDAASNDDDVLVVINLSATKDYTSKGVADLDTFTAIFAARRN
jgi:hypothetical protein